MEDNKHAWNTEILIRRIGQSGWTDENFEAFDALLGTTIRRCLIICSDTLQASAWGLSQRRRDRWRHVLEDTTSDLWIELSDSLVTKYLELVKTKGLECGFAAYLNGVIRLLLIDNARQAGLLPHHSVGELVRRYCRARRKKTRRRIIAMLKGRCQQMVRSEILAFCAEASFDDTYKNIHRITDHFFEAYLPAAVEQPRHEALPSLREMIERYVSSGMEGGSTFRGSICPMPQFQEISLDGKDISADELLSRASLRRGELRS